VAPDSAHDIGEPVRGVVREDALAGSDTARLRNSDTDTPSISAARRTRDSVSSSKRTLRIVRAYHIQSTVYYRSSDSIPTAIDLIYGQLYDRLLFRLGGESKPLEQLRALVCKVALHNSARRI